MRLPEKSQHCGEKLMIKNMWPKKTQAYGNF